jgi:hypothetical protein
VLSSKLSSTIGTERMYNAAMKIHPEDLFIRTFLAEMPEAPVILAVAPKSTARDRRYWQIFPDPSHYRPASF